MLLCFTVPHVGSVIGAVYGPGAAHVSWTLAFSGGLPVQFFEVGFKKVNSTQWQDDITLGSSNSSYDGIPPDFRSWIVNGLEAEEYYLFRIRARNELGYGNYAVSLVPTLSHTFGVPSPPSRPVIAGWAEDFALITSSFLTLGLPDAENMTVSVVLLENGVEIGRQMFELLTGYLPGSEFHLKFINLSYRGDWQFAVSGSNPLGASLLSLPSLHG